MARPLVIPILGNTSDLEASLLKAGVVAEDASKKITGSFRAAGLAAAEEARTIGLGLDEQAAAAGRAAAAFTEMSAKITTAQRNAGKAAAAAAGQVGASVDEQRAAYVKAIAVQGDYEASVARAADAAKVAATEQTAAAKRVAAEQVAASKAAADAAAKTAAAQTAAVDSARSKMASLGKWSLAGGLGVAAFSVKGAVDLQKQMEMLHTQAGAAQQQVGLLTKGVLNMAGSVGTAPAQLADGMYHVVSSLNATLPAATRSATELNVLRIAAEGAKVGGADLTDVTNALDAAIVSGISGVQNYHQAMGALNSIVGAGDMKMQDLANALSTGLLAPMKTYGLTLKDVGGALAIFGDNNIRGQEAATKLTSAVRIMAAPSGAAAKALAAVGLGSLQLANDMRSGGLVKALTDLKQHLIDSGATASEQGLIIARAFGGRQSTGVQVMLQNLDRLRIKTEQVGAGAHKFGGDWNSTTHTMSFQMDQLKATVGALADKFGMFLIPKLEAAGQAISSVINWMGRHKAAAEALAVVIGGVLGTAIGVFAYTKAIAFIGATKNMLTGIGRLAGGVADGAQAIVAKLGLLGPAAVTAEGEVATAGTGIVATADTTATGVDTALGATGIGLVLVGLGVGATELATHWSSVMNDMKAAVNFMVEAAESALNKLIGVLNTAIGVFNSTIGQLTGSIGKIGTVSVGGVFNTGGSVSGTNYTQSASQAAKANIGGFSTSEKVNAGALEGYFRQQGLSAAGAAALIGNFMQESSLNPSMNIGAAGAGLASWTTGSGRQQQLMAFSNQQKLPWNSLTAQVKFVMHELQGYPALLQLLQHTSNAAAAAYQVALHYEGPAPSTANYAGREKWASEVAQVFGGVSPSAASSSATGATGVPAPSGPLSSSLASYLAGASGGGKAVMRYRDHKPVGVMTPAQWQAWQAAHPLTTRSLMYANPLAGDSYNVERTDQGKDFGDIHGNLGAIGAGIITLAQNLSGFGQTIVEKLTSGPNKGREIYYGLETGATSLGLHVGQHVRAGQGIARGRGTGGVELGFWNPATGHAMDNAGFNGSNATPGGTAFAAFLTSIGDRGLYTTTNNGTGRTTGGGRNFAYELAKLEQAFALKIQTLANSLMTKYQTVDQSATATVLARTLGMNTGGKVGSELHNVIQRLGGTASLKQIDAATGPVNTAGFAEKLTKTLADVHGRALAHLDQILGQKHGTALNKLVADLTAVHGKALDRIEKKLTGSDNKSLRGLGGDLRAGPGNLASLTSLANKSVAGSPQEKAYEQTVMSLMATGQTRLAQQLVAAHKAAMATLAQELYAEQTLKDGEMLTITATQLKDQTTLAANHAQDELNVAKAHYQLANDVANQQVQAIRDMTQIVTDQMAGMVQAVQDHVQMMSDSANAVVTGINDQTQIKVDMLGERGLYGLNLVAQKQQVAADMQKASDDRAIALAQQNLDQVTTTAHVQINQAQISLDQLTAQQNALAAAAQQRADTVGIKEATVLAAAQARVDAITLHEDVSVIGPAQMAVDLGATLPKAQQDVLNAQLRKATGTAGVVEGRAGMVFEGIQASVNKLNATAQQSATEASANAQKQIALSTANLAQVTSQANLSIQLASGSLSSAQSAAALAEAPLTSQQKITSATAATQFAGTGTTVNVYGVPTDNAAAIGTAVDWVARTQLQVPS